MFLTELIKENYHMHVFWLQEAAEKEAAKREEEEQKLKDELEEYQKKLRGRKRKPRRQRTEEVEPTFFENYRWLMLGSSITVVAAILVYWLFFN